MSDDFSQETGLASLQTDFLFTLKIFFSFFIWQKLFWWKLMWCFSMDIIMLWKCH